MCESPDEEAFKTLDKVLALANERGVRLIIPIVNNFQWWGGAAEYAAFRGKQKNDFWTDPQLIDDFKKTVQFLITRINTVTGVPYREDKCILAWETGNETECPHSWTHEIATYIKSLDSNHLVMDGYNTPVLRDESIDDDTIDVIQTHHYENDPRQMIDHIKASVQKVKGRKPYMLGEFGFISTEATRAVLETVIGEKISGALIWSLRYHHRDGGFFWHSEPAGGDFFKAYHWPGFDSGEIYDERNLMAMMRSKAFGIQELPVPPLEKPAAPALLPIESVGAISWQGSAGASGYNIQRAESEDGPWTRIARNVSDAAFQYRPLFNDTSAEIGKTYYYRVLARNDAGVSPPSNVAGPVEVKYLTFVDEFVNDSKIFYHSRKLSIQRNQARTCKEDNHRLAGEKGEWMIYRTGGPIQLCKVYAYSDDDRITIPSDDKSPLRLKLTLSGDGQTFVEEAVQMKSFGIGQDAYGYLNPALYVMPNIPENTRYLKIEFTGKASLSRVEIQYGH